MNPLRIAWAIAVMAALAAVGQPASASPGTQIVQVSVGGGHTCARTSAGAAYCWGRNREGQLGDGGFTARSVPQLVPGLGSGVRDIVAAGSATCAVVRDGVWCWGSNPRGLLGVGDERYQRTPAPVSGLTAGVRSVALGIGRACAVLDDGGLRCWGANAHGAVGDGSTIDRTSPVAVTGLSGVVGAAVGDDHTCAVTGGGGFCWGGNTAGQLGDGTTGDQSTPQPIPGLPAPLVQLAPDSTHTCGLLRGGAVYCWGLNLHGALGDGAGTDSTRPVRVAGLPGRASAVSTDFRSGCARVSARAYCWGFNAFGKLGDGTELDRPVPVPVVGLPGPIRAVATGGSAACALTRPGQLWCWGHNQWGGLGDGTTADHRTPASVVGF